MSKAPVAVVESQRHMGVTPRSLVGIRGVMAGQHFRGNRGVGDARARVLLRVPFREYFGWCPSVLIGHERDSSVHHIHSGEKPQDRKSVV